MKWIKIEEGCDMPNLNEIVAIAKIDIGAPWWDHAKYAGADVFCQGDDFCMSGMTHWARVELPEE